MIDEKGSFRDPAGKIFYLRDKVYRKINKEGLNRLKYVIENDIISKSVDKKFLIKTKECEKKYKNAKWQPGFLITSNYIDSRI